METKEVKLRILKMFAECKTEDASVLYMAHKIIEKYEKIENAVLEIDEDEDNE